MNWGGEQACAVENEAGRCRIRMTLEMLGLPSKLEVVDARWAKAFWKADDGGAAA